MKEVMKVGGVGLCEVISFFRESVVYCIGSGAFSSVEEVLELLKLHVAKDWFDM